MKTTIEIPDPLYQQAKIHAVETGQTLKHLVINSLSRELNGTPSIGGEHKSFFARRQLLPGYNAALKSGAFRQATGARDVTDLISEDRHAR